VTPPRKLTLFVAALLSASPLAAQRYESWTREDTVRTAREVMPRTFQLPPWTNPLGFEKDVFTFVRVIFDSDPSRPGDNFFRRRSRRGWRIDFPDADLNFSYRLQQMTSLKVDSDGRVLRLTDPDLIDYPYIFMTHIERMALAESEASALGHYLLNGGVLLVNDFWGAPAWQNFVREMRQVIPGREWIELSMEHPIFHCIFDLRGPMSSLRVPTIHRWNRDYSPGNPSSNPTASCRGEGYETMHVRALLDDRKRIMVLAIHNSDVSDG
jgi:hypothetical protein